MKHTKTWLSITCNGTIEVLCGMSFEALPNAQITSFLGILHCFCLWRVKPYFPPSFAFEASCWSSHASSRAQAHHRSVITGAISGHSLHFLGFATLLITNGCCYCYSKSTNNSTQSTDYPLFRPLLLLANFILFILPCPATQPPTNRSTLLIVNDLCVCVCVCVENLHEYSIN